MRSTADCLLALKRCSCCTAMLRCSADICISSATACTQHACCRSCRLLRVMACNHRRQLGLQHPYMELLSNQAVPAGDCSLLYHKEAGYSMRDVET